MLDDNTVAVTDRLARTRRYGLHFEIASQRTDADSILTIISGMPILRVAFHQNGQRGNDEILGTGYVTPNDEHEGRGLAIRKARLNRLARHRQARQTRPAPGPDGLMCCAPQTFARKSEAERYLTLVEAQVMQGDWVDPERGRSWSRTMRSSGSSSVPV